MTEKTKSEKKAGNAEAPAPKPPRKKDVQAILDDVVWNHGSNRENVDVVAALTHAGISPEDLTDLQWDRAVQSAKQRLDADKNGHEINWPTAPVYKSLTSHNDCCRWDSTCSRYRLSRLTSAKRVEYFAERITGKKTSEFVERDPEMGPGYARRYATLEEAWEAVKRSHYKEFPDLKTVKSNIAEVLAAEPFEDGEEENSVETTPTPVPDSTIKEVADEVPADTTEERTEEGDEMVATKVEAITVKESKVRAMLEALGIDEATDWPLKKLKTQVTGTDEEDKPNLLKLVADGEELPDGSQEVRTLRRLTNALKEGMAIEIEPDDETNGHTETPTRTSPEAEGDGAEAAPKKRGPGRPKKADKEDKPKAKLDKFGTREGTDRAIFNAALSRKARTAKEIAEKIAESGGEKFDPGRIHNYYRKLAEKHPTKVQNGDKGWQLI